jgi:hypothetical protein
VLPGSIKKDDSLHEEGEAGYDYLHREMNSVNLPSMPFYVNLKHVQELPFMTLEALLPLIQVFPVHKCLERTFSLMK